MKPSAEKPSAEKTSAKKPSTQKLSAQRKDDEEKTGCYSILRWIPLQCDQTSHRGCTKAGEKVDPCKTRCVELFPRKYKIAKNRLRATAKIAEESGLKKQKDLIEEMRKQIHEFSGEDNWVDMFLRQILGQADRSIHLN